MIAAVFRYTFWDVLVTVTTTLAIGFPTFVIGLVLQQPSWACSSRSCPIFGDERRLEVLRLPAFTLAIVDAALVARLMRGSMLEVLRADYIRTAPAKGLSRAHVILKHALRNSIIPVVTYLGDLVRHAARRRAHHRDHLQLGRHRLGADPRDRQRRTSRSSSAVVTFGVAIFVVLNLIVDIALRVPGPADPARVSRHPSTRTARERPGPRERP